MRSRRAGQARRLRPAPGFGQPNPRPGAPGLGPRGCGAGGGGALQTANALGWPALAPGPGCGLRRRTARLDSFSSCSVLEACRRDLLERLRSAATASIPPGSTASCAGEGNKSAGARCGPSVRLPAGRVRPLPAGSAPGHGTLRRPAWPRERPKWEPAPRGRGRLGGLGAGGRLREGPGGGAAPKG